MPGCAEGKNLLLQVVYGYMPGDRKIFALPVFPGEVSGFFAGTIKTRDDFHGSMAP
jgi:hypothetical protein